jgi:hypothetical protein
MHFLKTLRVGGPPRLDEPSFRILIENKLSQLLVDDEAGWEAAANAIVTKIYNAEGIDIPSYDGPNGFSSALMDKLDYQYDLQGRFARGVDSLNAFDVAEELVWELVPSGFIFGK